MRITDSGWCGKHQNEQAKSSFHNDKSRNRSHCGTSFSLFVKFFEATSLKLVVLMTSQAGKLPAMAHRATCFVQLHVFAMVGVDEVRRVAGGFYRRPFVMAEFATEGRLDLVMANQAVGHLWEIRLCQRARLLHSPMTCSAGIRAVKMPPDITHRRQIRF